MVMLTILRRSSAGSIRVALPGVTDVIMF